MQPSASETAQQHIAETTIDDIEPEIINTTDNQSGDAEHEYTHAVPKTKSTANDYTACSSSKDQLEVDYEGAGYGGTGYQGTVYEGTGYQGTVYEGAASDVEDGGCEYEPTGNNRPLSTLSLYEQTNTFNGNQNLYADYDSLPKKERRKLEKIEQKRIRKEKRDALPVYDLPRIVPISMFGCLGVGFILTILVAVLFAYVLNGLNSDLDELRQDNLQVANSYDDLSENLTKSGVLEIPDKVVFICPNTYKIVVF